MKNNELKIDIVKDMQMFVFGDDAKGLYNRSSMFTMEPLDAVDLVKKCNSIEDLVYVYILLHFCKNGFMAGMRYELRTIRKDSNASYIKYLDSIACDIQGILSKKMNEVKDFAENILKEYEKRGCCNSDIIEITKLMSLNEESIRDNIYNLLIQPIIALEKKYARPSIHEIENITRAMILIPKDYLETDTSQFIHLLELVSDWFKGQNLANITNNAQKRQFIKIFKLYLQMLDCFLYISGSQKPDFIDLGYHTDEEKQAIINKYSSKKNCLDTGTKKKLSDGINKIKELNSDSLEIRGLASYIKHLHNSITEDKSNRETNMRRLMYIGLITSTIGVSVLVPQVMGGIALVFVIGGISTRLGLMAKNSGFSSEEVYDIVSNNIIGSTKNYHWCNDLRCFLSLISEANGSTNKLIHLINMVSEYFKEKMKSSKKIKWKMVNILLHEIAEQVYKYPNKYLGKRFIKLIKAIFDNYLIGSWFITINKSNIIKSAKESLQMLCIKANIKNTGGDDSLLDKGFIYDDIMSKDNITLGKDSVGILSDFALAPKEIDSKISLFNHVKKLKCPSELIEDIGNENNVEASSEDLKDELNSNIQDVDELVASMLLSEEDEGNQNKEEYGDIFSWLQNEIEVMKTQVNRGAEERFLV